MGLPSFGAGIARQRARGGTAVLSLALASALFLCLTFIADALVTAALPYKDVDRLVELTAASPASGDARMSSAELLDYERDLTSFSGLGAVQRWDDAVDWGTRTLVHAAGVSPGYFEVLGVTPQIGRTFTDADTLASGVAIISAGFWRTRFGGALDAVGRTVPFAGGRYVVIGVLPDDFEHFEPGMIDIWTPWAPVRARDNRRFIVVGRLRHGVSIEEARADLGRVSRQLAAQDSDGDSGHTVATVPLSGTSRRVLTPLATLLGIGMVAAVLTALLNLVYARFTTAIEDEQTLAIRSALGATPGRLAIGAISSAVFTTVLGVASGTALAILAWRPVLAWLTTFVPSLDAAPLPYGVLFATAGVLILISLVAAVVPTLYTWRTRLPIIAVPGDRRRDRQLVFRAMLVSQILCVTTLLVTAVGLGRAFLQAQAPDTGFSAADVSAVRVMLPPERATPDGARDMFARVQTTLTATPGVTAVGQTNTPPFTAVPQNRRVPLLIGSSSATDLAQVNVVGGHYFAALDIPLLAGRSFLQGDVTQPVAIVSAGLAARHGGAATVTGAPLRLRTAGDPARTIVGVVGDIAQVPGSDPELLVYVPEVRWSMNDTTFLIERDGPDAPDGRQLACVAQGVDASLFTAGHELSGVLRTLNGHLQAMAWVAGVSAAVLLALLGLAVSDALALFCRSRRVDSLIRLALGASIGQVRWLVIREAMLCLALGASGGLALWTLVHRLAAMLGRPLANVDTWSLIVALSLLSAVVVTGACLASRRFSDAGLPSVMHAE